MLNHLFLLSVLHIQCGSTALFNLVLKLLPAKPFKRITGGRAVVEPTTMFVVVHKTKMVIINNVTEEEENLIVLDYQINY